MTLPRTLRKLASPLLYACGEYQRGWRRRQRREPFGFVVFYHRVVADTSGAAGGFDIESGIPAAEFERQLRFLCRHFRPVRASRMQAELGGGTSFAVTLDDGYEDNYRVAAPILKRLGIPATFYVVSDYIGSDRLFWWEQVADMMRRSERAQLDLGAILQGTDGAQAAADRLPMRAADERRRAYEQLCAAIRRGRHAEVAPRLRRASDYLGVTPREEGRDYGMMNWRQLEDLVAQGFEIGGHTATHCNLVGADEALLRSELIDSVAAIEARLDTAVESFAYPYGIFEASSASVSGLLAQTGCKAAFTVEQGAVRAGLPAFELPRARLNRPWAFACAFNLQDALCETRMRAAAKAHPNG